MVENRRDDLDDDVGFDPVPSSVCAEVDSAVSDVWTLDAMERNDDRDRAWPLAVGTVIVGRRVLDPIVPVRMDLRHTGHPSKTEMATRLTDGVCRHDVVPRTQGGIGNDHGRRDEHQVLWRNTGVAGLVDAEPVQVSHALDTRFMLSEQIEHGVPDCLGDPDLCAHAACARFDGPTYAGPLSAVWMRLRVASTRSLPGRHA